MGDCNRPGPLAVMGCIDQARRCLVDPKLKCGMSPIGLFGVSRF